MTCKCLQCFDCLFASDIRCPKKHGRAQCVASKGHPGPCMGARRGVWLAIKACANDVVRAVRRVAS